MQIMKKKKAKKTQSNGNSSYTVDSIYNNLSGLGTSKDKGAANQFYARHIDPYMASEIYRGSWVAARIIDLPVFEAFREWRSFTFQDDGDLYNALEQAEKRYKVRDVLRKAITYANIFGGSAIMINVEGAGDISTPLDINRIKKGSLKWLSPIDRRRLYPIVTPDTYYPNSPNFMRPEYYTSNLDPNARDGSAFKIHRSRLLIFNGIELPPDEMLQNDFWGDSIYTRVFDAISNADMMQQALSSLVHKSSLDIWKIKDLAGALEKKDGQGHLSARISSNNILASLVNSVAIDKDNEEIERKSIGLSGLDTLLMHYLQLVPATRSIPISKFLGDSPSGLNSSGQSEVRNWYDTIKSDQEDLYRPNMERLDKILAASELGYVPEDLSFDFNPLWQMDEKQRADLELVRSQRDANYIQLDVMTRENVAKQLIVDETYQTITDEDAEALGDFGVTEFSNSPEGIEYSRELQELLRPSNGETEKP